MRGSNHQGGNRGMGSSHSFDRGAMGHQSSGRFIKDAETLTLNTETTAEISTTSETDLYAVSLVAGVTYTITLSSDDLSTPYAVLRNSDGQSVASDYQTSSETEATISYTPTQTGVYYLSLSDLSNDSTGEYTIIVEGDETVSDDYDNSIETTGIVAVDSNVTGQIETVGDADWFAVEMTANSTYTITLDTTGIELPNLVLLDADGNELESTYSISGNCLTIEYTAETDGTYYLEVSDLASNSIGTYTLAVESVYDAASDDYAASTSTTGTLTVDETASGELESAGDADWFAVTLEEGSVYDFSFTSSDFDSEELSLYDANGHLIDSSVSSTLTYTADDSATYYIAASQNTDTDTGVYVIGVQEVEL